MRRVARKKRRNSRQYSTQPRNVILGHVISAAAGLAVFHLLGHSPLNVALAVGLAIGGMQLSGTVHPPAGANPIVVMLASANWSFLLLPVLAGSVLIVLTGMAYHRLLSRQLYPALPGHRAANLLQS